MCVNNFSSGSMIFEVVFMNSFRYQLIRMPSIGSGTYKFVDLFEDVGTAVFVD